MGIDAKIFIKTKNGKHPDLGIWFLDPIEENTEEFLPEANYQVSITDRFYDESYARGPWPKICGILLDLFSDLDVEKVWYFGDYEDPKEFKPEDLLKLCEFYMKNGNRPYYK